MIWGPGVSDECVDWASSAPGVKAPEGNPVDDGGRAPGCKKKGGRRDKRKKYMIKSLSMILKLNGIWMQQIIWKNDSDANLDMFVVACMVRWCFTRAAVSFISPVIH